VKISWSFARKPLGVVSVHGANPCPGAPASHRLLALDFVGQVLRAPKVSRLLSVPLVSQPRCRRTRFPSKLTGLHEKHQLDDLIVQWSIGRPIRC
jgi:hypothetical protein